MMIKFQNGVSFWRRNIVNFFFSSFRYISFRKQTNEPKEIGTSVSSPAVVGRGRLLSMLQAGPRADSAGRTPTGPSTSSDEQRKSIGDTKRPETGKQQFCSFGAGKKNPVSALC